MMKKNLSLSMANRVACWMMILSQMLPFAAGSEAEFLPWRKIIIVSEEIPEAGRVTIEAETDKEAWISLSIEAFGRKESLKQEDLKSLHGFPLRSLHTTHEEGYLELGGYAVCLSFKRAFYDEGKNLKQEHAHIMITKNAPLTFRIVKQ